ncbi:MAG: hypothetical protein KDD19_16310 [Phaeodactylibacter sp.]|nr:hypothetical protein [Phaeodactylibacter sp.]MCB9053460.1 hypothetical protein [Lewinellaceae bacterium]
MNRSVALATVLIFSMASLSAQTIRELPPRAYELYPTLEDMYGYAVGKYKDYLLIFGGSIRSEADEKYANDFPNLDILMIDFRRNRAAAYTSGNLDGLLRDQISSTGMAYHQDGNTLYLLGGYGFSESNGQFITFPYLTAIDLQATVEALLDGKNPVANFFQICDERMAIFDATMDYDGEEFFLINGKSAYKLEPFSDTPVYVEEPFTGQARSFRLKGAKESLEISQFQTWYDLEGFRDYYGPLLPESIERELQLLLDKPEE